MMTPNDKTEAEREPGYGRTVLRFMVQNLPKGRPVDAVIELLASVSAAARAEGDAGGYARGRAEYQRIAQSFDKLSDDYAQEYDAHAVLKSSHERLVAEQQIVAKWNVQLQSRLEHLATAARHARMQLAMDWGETDSRVNALDAALDPLLEPPLQRTYTQEEYNALASDYQGAAADRASLEQRLARVVAAARNARKQRGGMGEAIADAELDAALANEPETVNWRERYEALADAGRVASPWMPGDMDETLAFRAELERKS